MQTIQSITRRRFMNRYSLPQEITFNGNADEISDPVDLSSLNTINPDTIAELMDLGGAEFVRQMIDAYRADARPYVEDIALGVRSKEIVRVERAAHSLKSACNNLGAERLGRISLQLELAALDRDWGRVERWSLKLASNVECVLERLGAIREQLPEE